MSMIYFIVGLVIGVALCIAFPGLPLAINKGVEEAKKKKQDKPPVQQPIIPPRY